MDPHTFQKERYTIPNTNTVAASNERQCLDFASVNCPSTIDAFKFFLV